MKSNDSVALTTLPAKAFSSRESILLLLLKLLSPQIQRLLHPLTQIELLQQRALFLREQNKPQCYIFVKKSVGVY